MSRTRPFKYTVQETLNIAKDYIAACKAEKTMPTVSGLAGAYGVSSESMRLWRKSKDKARSEAGYEIIRMIAAEWEPLLARNGNTAGIQFWLRACAGWEYKECHGASTAVTAEQSPAGGIRVTVTQKDIPQDIVDNV